VPQFPEPLLLRIIGELFVDNYIMNERIVAQVIENEDVNEEPTEEEVA